MSDNKITDSEKELKSLLYMAAHMELLSNELLGKTSQTTKTIKAARFAVMREIVDLGRTGASASDLQELKKLGSEI